MGKQNDIMTEEIVSSAFKFKANGQVAVGGKIVVDEQIEKILCVSCNARVSGGEALEGEARFNGVVTFKVAYLTTDGMLKGTSFEADFSSKIQNEAFSPKQTPIFSCVVDDYECAISSGSEMVASCALTVAIMCKVESNVTSVVGVGNGIYAKTQDISFCQVVGNKSQQIHQHGEQEAKEVVTGVLMSSGDVCIKNATTGLDCVVVTGEVTSWVIYTIENDGGCRLKTCEIVTPFKEEVPVNGAMVGQNVNVCACLVDSKVSVEVEEEMSRSKILVDLIVDMQCYVESEQTTKVVCDAFSPSNFLNVQTSEFETKIFSETYYSDEKISAQVDLDEKLEITKVIGVGACNIFPTSCYFKDGNIIIDGVATLCALCASDERPENVHCDIPFSIAVSAPNVMDGDMLMPILSISSTLLKLKKMSKMEIKVEICIRIVAERSKKMVVISDLTVGDKKPCCNSAIDIYMAKDGDSLWDVAKEMNVIPDIITKQNPEIMFPISKVAKIVVFKSKKTDFLT